MARKTANRDDGERGARKSIERGRGELEIKPLVFSQPSAALHYSAQMQLQPRCRLIKDGRAAGHSLGAQYRQEAGSLTFKEFSQGLARGDLLSSLPERAASSLCQGLFRDMQCGRGSGPG